MRRRSGCSAQYSRHPGTSHLSWQTLDMMRAAFPASLGGARSRTASVLRPHHSLYPCNSGVVAPSPLGSAPKAIDVDESTETASGDRGNSGWQSGSGSAIPRIPECVAAGPGPVTGTEEALGPPLRILAGVGGTGAVDAVLACPFGIGGIARSSIPLSTRIPQMRATLFLELWSSMTHM